MNKETTQLATKQLVIMREVIDQNSRGEYFISEVNMINISSEKLRILNWLLYRLVEMYPNYVWQQTEALDHNVRGITISWYPKHGR